VRTKPLLLVSCFFLIAIYFYTTKPKNLPTGKIITIQKDFTNNLKIKIDLKKYLHELDRDNKKNQYLNFELPLKVPPPYSLFELSSSTKHSKGNCPGIMHFFFYQSKNALTWNKISKMLPKSYPTQNKDITLQIRVVFNYKIWVDSTDICKHLASEAAFTFK